MNPIIVNNSPGEIRGIARKLLSGNWLMVVLGVAFASIMVAIIPQFFESCVPIGRLEQYNAMLGTNQSISVIASFYQFFFTGVFSVGLCSFLIAFVRMKDINPGYVFNGFEYYFKTLGLAVVIGVYTFLWSLLLIVPGIIAAFRYSQAFYILADDPRKGVMQCIQESKLLMYGNKANLFVLQLSFIGWLILGVLPYSIINAILQTAGMTSGIGQFLILLVGMIPMYIAMTYMETANTVFYEILTGHMVFGNSRPQQESRFEYGRGPADDRNQNEDRGPYGQGPEDYGRKPRDPWDN